MGRVWISERLNKSEKMCLALVSIGLIGMLYGALCMGFVIVLAPQDMPMPVWCLVSLLAGCVAVAIGGWLHKHATAKRIVSEAVYNAAQ